jgi:hypothetical protein
MTFFIEQHTKKRTCNDGCHNTASAFVRLSAVVPADITLLVTEYILYFGFRLASVAG